MKGGEGVFDGQTADFGRMMPSHTEDSRKTNATTSPKALDKGRRFRYNEAVRDQWRAVYAFGVIP